MYSVFRKLENGDLLPVRSYVELEEAQRLVALFNECWPNQYCVQEKGKDADVEG